MKEVVQQLDQLLEQPVYEVGETTGEDNAEPVNPPSPEELERDMQELQQQFNELRQQDAVFNAFAGMTERMHARMQKEIMKTLPTPPPQSATQEPEAARAAEAG
jgi:hypothetical protein